jgi:hypothetical protein
MPATARLIVMMEQEEKSALEAQAEAAKVSTAEFVRRRLFGRGAPEEGAFLQMLAELEPLVRQATETIDANLAEIRAMRGATGARTAPAGHPATSGLTRDELSVIADRLHLASARPTPRRRSRVRG